MCMHVGTREEENHWFAIKTCAARSTRDEISDCVPVLQAARAGRLKRVQLAWASNGSLETVRNSGVPGSLYTKPRNRENAMSAQSIATGNPETGSLRTTDKTRFAPFYRNDHLYSIFFFFFYLCSEYMSEVCKVCFVNLGHGNTPRKVLIM